MISKEYFKSAEDLKEKINNTTDEQLQENAKTMKALAMEHYQWKTIAEQYYDFFRSGVISK